MQPEMTPISVVDQVVIRFAGHDFLVVRVPDGRVAVVLRHLCEALDLDRHAQTRRIQSHSALAKHLLLVRIKTPGGPQVVNALVTSALALWLGGFRLGRYPEEKQALIRRLQRDAADAFDGHFHKIDTAAPPQQQAKAAQSLQLPLPAQDQAQLSVYDMYHALISRMEQENQQLKARLTSVEQENQQLKARQNNIERQHDAEVAWMTEAKRQMLLQREEMEIFWSIVLGKASGAAGPLSADHHQTLELWMDLHHRATGQPLASIKRELLKAVGVVDLSHLQESDWKQIVSWFRQQLGW